MKVTASKFAAELGVTSARISQLRAQGLPEPVNGRFDLIDCFRRYTRFLQNALAHRTVPEAGSGHRSIVEARRRKLEADTEMRELEVARERGQLIPIPLIEKDWSDLVTTTPREDACCPGVRE